LWCINSGHCCSEEICRSWGDYISDVNKCRTNGAVDRLTTFWLSIIPFNGLNNFYKGKIFDGWCELADGILALISIIAISNCYDSYRNRFNEDASSVAAFVGMGIAILDLVKAIYMVATGSVETTEIFTIIISLMIVCIHCQENDTREHHGIVTAFIITIITGVLETIRDVYTTIYDRDGYGCPFV